MGTKKKASDKLYFSKKTKLPFTHFSSPSILKVETQVTHWNKLTENNTLPPSNLLQKFSLKKKKSSYKNYTSYKFQMLQQQNQNI